MSLEEIRELINNKNIVIQNPDNKEKVEKDLEKLSQFENYKVIESICGVAFSEKGTYNLSQTSTIIKENPDKTYLLVPVK
jgi:hypothetical protein